MKVFEAMTPDVVTVAPDASLTTAARLMRESDIGPLPVCEGRRVIGMLTDRDITVRAIAEGRDPNQTRVAEVMTPEVVCCQDGDDVQRAPAGSFIFIPRGAAHCFQNVGDRPARVLVIFTPSGMERFFERFGALPRDQANLEAFRAIGAEVGMAVVGPPLAVSHPE